MPLQALWVRGQDRVPPTFFKGCCLEGVLWRWRRQRRWSDEDLSLHRFAFCYALPGRALPDPECAPLAPVQRTLHEIMATKAPPPFSKPRLSGCWQEAWHCTGRVPRCVHQNRTILCGCSGDFYLCPAKFRHFKSAVKQRGRERKGPPRNHPEISSQKVADFECRFPYDSYGKNSAPLSTLCWGNIQQPLLLPAPLFLLLIKAPRCADSLRSKIASERQFPLRLKQTKLIPTAEFGIPCDTSQRTRPY